METTTKVLVIRFSSMGDIILTSPVVRALHVLLDGTVEVHFLTKTAFAQAVNGLDGVARVWTIDRTTAEVESDLRQEGFHYVVDLHANARSGFVKRALRKGEGRTLDLTVDKRSLDKIVLVRTGWDRMAGQHVVERYLDTLMPFGNALQRLGDTGDEARLTLPPVARSAGQPVDVVLALGAAHEGKAIPEDHWSAVVAGLVADGRGVHLIGGPAERDLADRLMKTAGKQGVNHCGSPWAETFSLLSRASMLVAGDTGAMHAGAALQVPMVVVWGCTSPALGMGPWRAHPATVELEPEDPQRSRPCSRLGDRCRHRRPCIHRVSPKRILVAARHILSQTAP